LLESASPRLTQTDAIMGTPAYISPEQAQGQTVDRRSDIYSLGIILYEMVTGSVPYTAETPLAVLFKHISDPLPPPSLVKPDVPASIEKVLLKALAKHPQDRFATVDEFVTAWKRALEPANSPCDSRRSTSTEICHDDSYRHEDGQAHRLDHWLSGCSMPCVLGRRSCSSRVEPADLFSRPSHRDALSTHTNRDSYPADKYSCPAESW
jgi:serine/threonine protein kinase